MGLFVESLRSIPARAIAATSTGCPSRAAPQVPHSGLRTRGSVLSRAAGRAHLRHGARPPGSVSTRLRAFDGVRGSAARRRGPRAELSNRDGSRDRAVRPASASAFSQVAASPGESADRERSWIVAIEDQDDPPGSSARDRRIRSPVRVGSQDPGARVAPLAVEPDQAVSQFRAALSDHGHLSASSGLAAGRRASLGRRRRADLPPGSRAAVIDPP